MRFQDQKAFVLPVHRLTTSGLTRSATQADGDRLVNHPHGCDQDAIRSLHLNQKELARRWRISPRTLERWRWLREGPSYLKIGGKVIYKLTEVEAFEAARVHAPSSCEERTALRQRTDSRCSTSLLIRRTRLWREPAYGLGPDVRHRFDRSTGQRSHGMGQEA